MDSIYFSINKKRIEDLKSLLRVFNDLLNDNELEDNQYDETLKKADDFIKELTDLEFKDNRNQQNFDLNYYLTISLINALIKSKILLKLIKERNVSKENEEIKSIIDENNRLIDDLNDSSSISPRNSDISQNSYQDVHPEDIENYAYSQDNVHLEDSIISMSSQLPDPNDFNNIYKDLVILQSYYENTEDNPDKKTKDNNDEKTKDNDDEMGNYYKSYQRSNIHWPETNKLIDLKYTYIIDEKLDVFLKKLKENEKQKNIENLKIGYFIDTQINLRWLNDFSELRKLQIFSIYELKFKHLKLELSNLEILQIEDLEKDINKKITIKSAKLRYLFCDNLNLFNIGKKDQLEYLRIRNCDKVINKFTNLKTLIFTNYEILDKIDISKFKVLKKLSYVAVTNIFDEFSSHKLERKELLNNSKIEFEKFLTGDIKDRDIEVYYLGFKLNSNDRVNELIYHADKLIIGNQKNGNLFKTYYDYCYENYDNLSNITDFEMITKVNYNVLFKAFKSKTLIPKDIVKVFKNIHVVSINGIPKDLSNLINFLKECKHLFGIKFEKTKLTNDFYNKLDEYTNNKLTDIYIVENSNLDFNFIFKFSLLEEFETFQYLDSKFIEEILKNLRNIKAIHYRHQNDHAQKIKIFKRADSISLLYKRAKKIEFTDECNETGLINHLKDLDKEINE